MTEQEKVFIEACIKNDFKVVRKCMDYSVNIHIEDDWAFSIAIINGHTELILYLLNNGVSIEKAVELGALRYASHNKQYEVVRYLMNYSEEFKKDSGALQWAIDNGDLEMVKLIISYVNDVDSSYCSAAKCGSIEIIEFLNENQIYLYDRNMSVVLNWAIKYSKFNVAKLLIDNGIVAYETLADSYRVKYELWNKSNR